MAKIVCDRVSCYQHSFVSRDCGMNLDPNNCDYKTWEDGIEKGRELGFSDCLYDYPLRKIMQKRIIAFFDYYFSLVRSAYSKKKKTKLK